MELVELGWRRYAPEQAPHSSYGRIAMSAREHFLIWTGWGECEGTISGRFRHVHAELPCVGDWVVLRDGSIIVEVLPRRTKLSRREPGKGVREQVLAANIDVLFIVSGLDRDYNPRRLERYLVLAYEGGARPVILLNKSDLLTEAGDVVEETKRYAPGVPVLLISALRGQALELIHEQVQTGETAALIGSSGAGKSTIVNSLLGSTRQQTADVREGDARGRHTTTRRELILLPERWLLMDMPGLRELQLWAEPERIDDAFSEISELARHCRFRDCRHEVEPGCAVRSAGLDEQRLGSYRKLKKELAFLERQSDFHLARETKQKWKNMERAMRRNPKR